MFVLRHLQLEQQCSTALLRREPAGARGGTVSPLLLYAGRRMMGRKMKELWGKKLCLYTLRDTVMPMGRGEKKGGATRKP
jgi:hypothetical protein